MPYQRGDRLAKRGNVEYGRQPLMLQMGCLPNYGVRHRSRSPTGETVGVRDGVATYQGFHRSSRRALGDRLRVIGLPVAAKHKDGLFVNPDGGAKRFRRRNFRRKTIGKTVA